MAKKQFKAESKRLLDLMINSIYTHREIFLRELISNGSDAIDKLCFLSLTDEGVGMERGDFCIRLQVDKEARTLTVSDNGIGMTAAEMEQNLGVIAKSGTKSFRDNLDAEKAAEADVDVIGQFGVGFYSAFMVAKKVQVLSRAYGQEEANLWQSEGVDGYTITAAEKESVGTDVILYLKDDGEDEKYSEFLQGWKLEELVKKYSDYIRWPIKAMVERNVKKPTGEYDENGIQKMQSVYEEVEDTINSMVPIWQRSRKDATDEECIAFYKDSFHDGEDPVSVIRVNAEGLVSYRCLLFIPAKAPYDFYSRDYQSGLRLYSNGVMIMDKCADLLPDCFRFVRGIVDSPDLSLNISRELLQHDRQLKLIANNLEKKIKAELTRLLENEREKYERFFDTFGIQLKYGIVGDYGMKKDMLQDLLLYYSAAEGRMLTLKEYTDKMPGEQKYIYYASAESAQRAAALPQTERVRARGYDFLCFTYEADEFVTEILRSYGEKEFRNVCGEDLGLDSEEEKAESEKANEDNKALIDFVKEQCGARVESVKISSRLESHPVCLSAEGEITLEMERYFRSLPGVDMNAMNMKARRVLELNLSHSAVRKLDEARMSGDTQRAAAMAKVLLTQAEIAAGYGVEDPNEYTELVVSLF